MLWYLLNILRGIIFDVKRFVFLILVIPSIIHMAEQQGSFTPHTVIRFDVTSINIYPDLTLQANVLTSVVLNLTFQSGQQFRSFVLPNTHNRGQMFKV